MGLGLGAGPLGDEVVDVGRPVLDGRVRDASAGQGDELDHRRVQRVGGVHRRRAALDVVHLGTLVGDDQRALELARVLLVDAEVGLQRHLHLDARRHVDERATAPHGGVQGRELVVAGRNDRAEEPLDDLLVVTQSRVHVGEQDPLGGQVVPVLVVNDFTFILRRDAGEVLALGFGDAELLVGLLHRLGERVPLVDLLPGGLQVVVDVLEVELRHVDREPGRHGLAFEDLQGAEAELGHPLRLFLDLGDLADDVFVEPLLGLVQVVDLVAPAELVATEVEIGCSHQATSPFRARTNGISTT